MDLLSSASPIAEVVRDHVAPTLSESRCTSFHNVLIVLHLLPFASSSSQASSTPVCIDQPTSSAIKIPIPIRYSLVPIIDKLWVKFLNPILSNLALLQLLPSESQSRFGLLLNCFPFEPNLFLVWFN